MGGACGEAGPADSAQALRRFGAKRRGPFSRRDLQSLAINAVWPPRLAPRSTQRCGGRSEPEVRVGTRASGRACGKRLSSEGDGGAGCWGVAGRECGGRRRRLRRTWAERDWRGRDLWGRGRALLPVVSLSGRPLAKPSLLAGGNVHQSTGF